MENIINELKKGDELIIVADFGQDDGFGQKCYFFEKNDSEYCYVAIPKKDRTFNIENSRTYYKYDTHYSYFIPFKEKYIKKGYFKYLEYEKGYSEVSGYIFINKHRGVRLTYYKDKTVKLNGIATRKNIIQIESILRGLESKK